MATKRSIEEAVKAATEAARWELIKHGFQSVAASIAVSAYTEQTINSAVLLVGQIPKYQAAGGYARAAKLPAETRSEIARKAANARWGKRGTHGKEIKGRTEEDQGDKD